MDSIRKILVPVDFSDESKIALHFAINIVGHSSASEVLMIYVSDTETESDDILILEALLKDTRDRFVHSDNVTCKYLIEKGDLTDSIIKVQSEQNSDLIVMGTKGAWTGELISNTGRLVSQTDCPVLVVPEIAESLFVKQMALAVDDKDIVNLFNVNIPMEIAKALKAQVHALTIDNGLDAETAGKNRDLLEGLFHPLNYTKAVLQHSDIEKGIAQYTRNNDIDLLTLFLRSRLVNGAASEGKLTQVLTKHAHTPLLIICH